MLLSCQPVQAAAARGAVLLGVPRIIDGDTVEVRSRHSRSMPAGRALRRAGRPALLLDHVRPSALKLQCASFSRWPAPGSGCLRSTRPRPSSCVNARERRTPAVRLPVARLPAGLPASQPPARQRGPALGAHTAPLRWPSPAALPPAGLEAKEALQRKVDGRQVACEARNGDKYGRTVAVCSLPPARGQPAEDLNAWQVEQGHAIAYR